MKSIFKVGDKKIYKVIVKLGDIAQFDGKTVHPVCSTFALAAYIEWSSRLFVLEMKEEDEEGIGTSLTVYHKSAALVKEELEIEAVVKSIAGNELVCTYSAKVKSRLIAEGETGQKILKKAKIKALFRNLEGHGKAEG